MIDGKEVGKIKHGATEDFVVQPGRHSVSLTIDWKGSDEIAANVDAGTIARFVCAPNGSAALATGDVLRKSKAWITVVQE